MNRTLLKILLALFATVGLVISAWLTVEHFRFLADPEHEAICDISETVSCRAVTTSPWSEVPTGWLGLDLPLPISTLGVGFFAAALALVLLGWAREERFGRRASALLVTMALPAILGDVVLAWAMVFQIGAYCVFCIALYGCNLAIFGLAWMDRGGSPLGAIADSLRDLARPGPSWGAALVFVTVSSGVHVVYSRQAGELQSNSIVAFLGDVDEALKSAKPVAVERGEHALGTPGAPFVLVEYADFECPHCRMVAPEMERLVERYREHVYFVFRHYPLDQACNPFMQRPLHKTACLAAKATECAERDGKFWEMHRQLFAVDSAEYSEEVVLGYAEKLGIDRYGLYQCLQDESVTEMVRKQVETGKDLGVRSTPTVFLNGVQLAGGSAPLQAELIIRDQLKKKGVSLPPPVAPLASEVR